MKITCFKKKKGRKRKPRKIFFDDRFKSIEDLKMYLKNVKSKDNNE